MTPHRYGGLAALYLALVNLVGMVIFLVILDDPHQTTPMERLHLLVDHRGVVFTTNLLMYIFFGVALVVMLIAVYDLLRLTSRGLAQLGLAMGVIWAGSLMASGMVANAGADRVLSLYAVDRAQASLLWQGIEPVANGLGYGNGEILGGLLTLSLSAAALRSNVFPRYLNLLGLLVGLSGILSLFPPLTSILIGVFGLTQVGWFAWLGIVLMRQHRPSPGLAEAPHPHPAATPRGA